MKTRLPVLYATALAAALTLAACGGGGGGDAGGAINIDGRGSTGIAGSVNANFAHCGLPESMRRRGFMVSHTAGLLTDWIVQGFL